MNNYPDLTCHKKSLKMVFHQMELVAIVHRMMDKAWTLLTMYVCKGRVQKKKYGIFHILRIQVCFRWPKKKCEVPGFYPLESLVLWPRVSGKKKFLKSEL